MAATGPARARARARAREANLGKGLAYTMVLLVFTVVMVLAVLPPVLGGFTRRPEGAAYRFLNGVSTEEDHDIETYGDPALAGDLTRFEREDDDDDWFDRVEVGEAVVAGGGNQGARVARVPVLLVQRDEAETEVALTAVVHEEATGSPKDWKVAAVETRDAGTRVPSEGGDHPARAPAVAWVIALGIGVVLTAGSAAILRAL